MERRLSRVVSVTEGRQAVVVSRRFLVLGSTAVALLASVLVFTDRSAFAWTLAGAVFVSVAVAHALGRCSVGEG